MIKMIRLFFSFLFLVIILFSCSAPNNDKIVLSFNKNLTLTISPTNDYYTPIRILFANIYRPAIIACWLETAEGNFLETLFVSKNAAKGTWYGAPSAGRPEALPVWTHKSASTRYDSTTGATPTAGNTKITNSLLKIRSGIYLVKFEINSPFDYNTFFPKESVDGKTASAVNGQPSLVYSGKITLGKGPEEIVLKLMGSGSVDGSDGEIHGLTGVTTASNKVQAVTFNYAGEP